MPKSLVVSILDCFQIKGIIYNKSPTLIGKIRYYDYGVNKYTGVSTIIPKSTDQVLLTANTVISENITILGIPYYETSNEANGYTVIIGGN